MPLRRPASEPSPRLRALLERAQSGAAETVDPPAVERVEFWQPDRAWIATTPAAPGVPVPPARPTRPLRPPGAVASLAGAPRPVQTGADAATVDMRPAARRGRHRRPRPPAPAWLSLPESLRGGRVSVSRAAVVGLLLAVVVAGAVFGVRVAMARAASEPRPVAPTQGATLVKGSTFASGSTSGAGGGGPPTTTAALVTVHVVGQVVRPGLVRLPAGARVADAITKAGGARKGADLAGINLARVLVDGEQLRVPKPGEAVSTPVGGAPGAGAGDPGAGTGAASGGLVNLNSATQAQLEELPGVGPVLAQRIIDWRTEHGRFTSVDELGEVSGIGEKIFAQLQPKVTV